MLLDLLAMFRDNSLGAGKPSVRVALDSAMLWYDCLVSRLSCGTPPVAGPLRAGAPGNDHVSFAFVILYARDDFQATVVPMCCWLLASTSASQLREFCQSSSGATGLRRQWRLVH